MQQKIADASREGIWLEEGLTGLKDGPEESGRLFPSVVTIYD